MEQSKQYLLHYGMNISLDFRGDYGIRIVVLLFQILIGQRVYCSLIDTSKEVKQAWIKACETHYPTKKRHLHADLCSLLFLKYNENFVLSEYTYMKLCIIFIFTYQLKSIIYAHNCHNGYEITAHFPYCP